LPFLLKVTCEAGNSRVAAWIGMVKDKPSESGPPGPLGEDIAPSAPVWKPAQRKVFFSAKG
jgi:hypothetical protein